MAFWGVEVKPGKPYTLRADDVGGKLILTQATLGTVSSPKKSTLQCIVGNSSPVFICTLLPDKSECCSLNLEFDEEGDVNFSVVGPTSIHLSGFLQADHHKCDDPDCDDPDCGADSDSYGEDIAETESDDSEYDSEDGEEYDFIDDEDDPLFSRLAVPNRGVVIEEIVDDDMVTNENGGSEQPKKKKQSTDSENDKQIVVKERTNTSVLESEDEDGFPVSSSHQEDTAKGKGEDVKKKKKKNDTKADSDGAKSLKRKADICVEDSKSMSGGENDVSGAPEIVLDGSLSKNKKKKKKGKAGKTDVAVDNKNANATATPTSKNEKFEKLNTSGEATDVGNGDVSEDKKKKKKKKAKKENGDEIVKEENNTPTADKGVKQAKTKPAKVRTFPNGLVIEDLQMGKPDGKRASRGSKVSVIYIGKLQKNGKQFDSNIGRAPFKFRLGVGSVIKGWDVGVEGMRVGDKRRVTIPPSMGYGAKGAPPQIPPNAWLLFDVELVSVA